MFFVWAILRKTKDFLYYISNLNGQKGNKPLLQRKKKGPIPVEMTNKSPQWSFNSESDQFVCFCWLVRLVYSPKNYRREILRKKNWPINLKTEKHAKTSLGLKPSHVWASQPISIFGCFQFSNWQVPFQTGRITPPCERCAPPNCGCHVSREVTFFWRRFWVWERINEVPLSDDSSQGLQKWVYRDNISSAMLVYTI